MHGHVLDMHVHVLDMHVHVTDDMHEYLHLHVVHSHLLPEVTCTK